jgi:hypothetical protein
VLTVQSGHNLLLFSVIAELSHLSLLKFVILLSLTSKLMVTCLDDRMVNTHNGWVGAENAQGNGNPSPPSNLAQAIASILESQDEQTELLRQLVVAMGQDMLPLQLRPHKATSPPLTRCSSPM